MYKMEIENVFDAEFAVLTVSDTCYADPSKDRSGIILQQLLQDQFEDAKVRKLIVPDEFDQIQSSLIFLSDMPGMRLVITTGGTGFAPRDVTPEATKPIFTKECAQLTMAIARASLEQNKFAALTRGVSGIRNKTLILNFPGSQKAVVENFEVIRDLLPHAISLLKNDLKMVKKIHAEMNTFPSTSLTQRVHRCPHATALGSNTDVDRNSPYPMVTIAKALEILFNEVQQQVAFKDTLNSFKSPIDIPPFCASIKDGYAMKSSGLPGTKRVLGVIHAGDKINDTHLKEDECFKINTGAPLPIYTDCVIQVEDTEVILRNKNGDEEFVHIQVQPIANIDIRPIGHDLAESAKLFPQVDFSPVVIRSLMASIGNVTMRIPKPKIAIISTGSELLSPSEPPSFYKIYDSNTTMLKELLSYFGFNNVLTCIVKDDFSSLLTTIGELCAEVDFIICSGGVSMGDKDYIKQVLHTLDFKVHFGRVNMKPGKPFTFATNKCKKYFFGLPGNPVSAFVTFHLFALPALRWYEGWKSDKCGLAVINVKLQNLELQLDARPEYARATVISKQGQLYALITGNQISSRLQSICGADVLIHLPACSDKKKYVKQGDLLHASILRLDFISKYE